METGFQNQMYYLSIFWGRQKTNKWPIQHVGFSLRTVCMYVLDHMLQNSGRIKSIFWSILFWYEFGSSDCDKTDLDPTENWEIKLIIHPDSVKWFGSAEIVAC